MPLSDNEFKLTVDFLAAEAKKDFVSYLHFLWPQVEGQTYKLGKVHVHIASMVQDLLVEPKATAVAVSLPPQTGKSRLISVRMVSWVIGAFPSIGVALTGFSHQLLTDFVHEVQAIVDSERYRMVFGELKAVYGRGRADQKHYNNGSSIIVKSSGSKLTGRRVDLLIIDDPHSGRAEAESAANRRRLQQWYFADCVTRLAPKAKQFIIGCMTGDTPVLMDDGFEKPLRDVKVGDRVATYDNGVGGVSTVLNWINHGCDYLFAITMSSGVVVRANERHPFLVIRGERTEWVRLRNLKMGDQILRARKSGEGGKELCAPMMGVKSLQSVKGCAARIMARHDGPRDIPHLPQIQKEEEGRTCDIGMGSTQKTMKRCSLPKEVDVPYVENLLPKKTHVVTRTVGSALTTTTTLEKSEDYFATVAILQLPTEEPQKRFCEHPSMLGFIPDQIVGIEPAGYEDVFDMEVERTENFIANGLVSHNTRWHPQDLIGHLTSDEFQQQLEIEGHGGKRLDVVNFPALATADGDALGRSIGDSVFPEERDRDFFEALRATMPSYEWDSQYQGNPRTSGGGQTDLTKINKISLDQVPMDRLEIVRGWDLALTVEKRSDSTAGPLLGYDKKNDFFYLLDMFVGKHIWPDMKKIVVKKALQDRDEWGLQRIGVEAVSGFSIGYDELRKELLGEVMVEKRNPTKDKLMRARPWLNKIDAGKFFMVQAAWNRAFLDELDVFPEGNHDDQIDGISICVEMVTQKVKLLYA